jgi:hypothetical protein
MMAESDAIPQNNDSIQNPDCQRVEKRAAFASRASKSKTRKRSKRQL